MQPGGQRGEAIGDSRRVRVLAITYGLPWPLTEGAKIRDFHLLREMARGAEVSLLAFCKDDRGQAALTELQRFCASVEAFIPPSRVGWRQIAGHLQAGWPLATLPFYSAEFGRRIAVAVERFRPTSVQIEHSFLAPYVSHVPAGCRTVLSLHNIGERQYGSMARVPGSGALAGLKARAMRGWEAEWARRFTACITVSGGEAEWVRQRAPGVPVTVVENGVDCAGLPPLPPAGTADVLFIGVLGYPPNADAVAQFVGFGMPVVRRAVPSARFVVVGRNAPPKVRDLASAGLLELHENVPDVLPFYRRAAVCVCPLRAGGGTRLKILEAMALGRPVVSTPLGCEGLAVAPGEHLLLAPDAAGVAAEVVRLLREPGLGVALVERARRHVEAQHDWPLLGRRLLALHAELAA